MKLVLSVGFARKKTFLAFILNSISWHGYIPVERTVLHFSKLVVISELVNFHCKLRCSAAWQARWSFSQICWTYSACHRVHRKMSGRGNCSKKNLKSYSTNMSLTFKFFAPLFNHSAASVQGLLNMERTLAALGEKLWWGLIKPVPKSVGSQFFFGTKTASSVAARQNKITLLQSTQLVLCPQPHQCRNHWPTGEDLLGPSLFCGCCFSCRKCSWLEAGKADVQDFTGEI